ncbi:VCBS repeat-containing protein [Spirosoma sp. BT702]|uniref:VCBS repeat-containing protein n=1 Tax=Spirosoma profusum TaxID=2771354 RepID=A0A927AVZ3_9BACT|nr:FG-GAP-like repeat-containing protein [Spirosoma profusum]MBD2705422.1 VCBS repeat-containing protein [Spirosoma profusum]
MKHTYYRLVLLLTLWFLVQLVSGQPLTLTGLNPVRNARNAPRTTNVGLTFNQSLSTNAATLGGVRLFSAQGDGLLRNGQGGSASVSSNTLTFNPTTNFKPGETIFVTSTTAIQGTGGGRLSRGQIHQFTTGVGGTGKGNFTAPATNSGVGVEVGAFDVAVGDLDGDGDLDLVCASSFRSIVSVRLNNGTGSFTTPAVNSTLAAGVTPRNVVLGDVDGDGDLDLLIANSNSSNVSVRLNNGSASFTPHPANPEVSVGGGAWGMTLGDVDGDGDLDLLTANTSGTTVSVRLNNGSGIFTPHPTSPEVGVGDSPYGVTLGDLDGDGDLDLATANSNSNNVSIRLNNGAGSFTPPTLNAEIGAGENPSKIAFGDIDGDGDLDMVFTNYNSRTVSVRLNNGSASFTPHPTSPEVGVGSSPYGVVLGDVDGDGDLDFVAANSSYVSVRLNDGLGAFTAPATNPNPNLGFNPWNVALGDLDGDGDLDFVAPDYNSAAVGVRLNGPLPPSLTDLSASPNPVCVGQPLSVVASVGNLSGSYSYTLSNGSNPISGSATTSAFSQSLTAGGSGVQTFTLTVSSGGQVTTATTSVTVTQCITLTGLNPVRNARSAPRTTNVALTFNQPVSSNPTSLSGLRVFSAQRGGLLRNGQGGSASVSGNTLTFNPGSDFKPGETVFVTSTTAIQSTGGAQLNRGQVYGFTTGVGGSGRGNFTAPAINPEPGVGSGASSVALGDVDGDGDLDFVTSNYGDNNVSVRLNDGLGNYTAPATNPNPRVGTVPSSVVLGDVDGDGDLDFVAANSGSTTVSVRLNNGAGNFTPPTTNPDPAVGGRPFSVALGDVDGDGDLDLVTVNGAGNTVSVRFNNGSGNFTPPAINPEIVVGSGASSVALGDVDGDGDLDFVTSNYGDNNVSVRLNDGVGNFTPPATNPNPAVDNSPWSVALGDVDGDSDLDLLTANYYSNTVSVRLNNGAGNFTLPATNPNPVVGEYPFSVALGDVDGDGDLDLVTANGAGNTVSVRLNNGSGNFTPPAITPEIVVGDYPETVVVGDVDGDGDLDFLAANVRSNSVSVRLNLSLPPTLTGLLASPNPVCTGQPISVVASVGNLSGSYSYTLTNGSNPISGSATTSAFSQSLTATGSGVQVFTLTVSSEGQIATATTSVTVNARPALRIGTPTGTTLTCTNPVVSLSAVGTGTYRWSTGATTSAISVSTAATYSLTLTGANGCSSTATASVSADQNPPTVSISPASATLSCITSSVSLSAIGVGTYRWSTGATTSSISATAAGPYSVTLTGTNGCFSTATLSVTADQTPPTVSISPPSATLSCTTSSVSLSAVGEGTYRWSTGATTSTISVSVAGSYSVTLTGTNGCSASTSASVGYQNCAPTVAAAIPDQAATVGDSFSYTIPVTTFTDAETPNSLSLSVIGLPAGLSFVAPNTITGVPSTTVGSPFRVTVVATDPGGLSASTTFVLSVQQRSFAITGVTMLDCNHVGYFERRINFTVSFEATNGQPISLSVVNETRTIAINEPYQLNVFTDNPVIVFKARQQGTPGEATFSYNWLRDCANGNPRVANAIPPQSTTVGQAFSYVIPANTFTDAETPNNLSLSAVGLPPGLSLVAPATIAGTVSASASAFYGVTVIATDPAGGSVSTLLPLSVVTPGGCVSMYSVKAGDWSDGSVWSCGRVPLLSDAVTLNHAVSLPASYQGQALRVIYAQSGRLLMGAESRLRLGGN